MVSLVPSAACAGAWTLDTGKYQLITSLSYYQTDEYFDRQSNRQPQQDYQKAELGYYLEYGAMESLTIGGNWSTVRAAQDTATGTTDNINMGDLELFARKRIWQEGASVWSLQPSVIIPSPDDKNDSPKVGGDSYAYGLTGNFGHNFMLFGRSHYVDIAAGYIHRTGTPDDYWKVDSTVGITLDDTWSLMPQLFVTRTTGSTGGTGLSLSSADNYDLAKLQVSVLYKLSDKRRIQLGAFAPIQGENTGAGHGILLGFWIQN